MTDAANGWHPAASIPLNETLDLIVDGRRFIDCTFAHGRWGYPAWRGRGPSRHIVRVVLNAEPTHWMRPPALPGD